MSLIRFCNKPVNANGEDFINAFFPTPFLASNLNQWLPTLDVAEQKDSYTVQLDLPGIKKEDVHVSFEEGILTIQGERKQESEQKDKEYHRIERSYGRFERSLNLGSAVDPERIQANYKDGVLEIIVAKSEKAKPKAIDIKVG